MLTRIRFNAPLLGGMIVTGVLALAGPATAAIQFDAGSIAIDQPTVSAEVLRPENGGLTSLGLTANRFLLDTGASSVFVGGSTSTNPASAYDQLDDNGAMMEEGTVEETGVAGTEIVQVSEPLTVEAHADSSGTSAQRSEVRMLSDRNSVNFGSFNGLMGMPAMQGRVTSLDLTRIKSDLSMGETFQPGDVPAPDANVERFRIPTTMRGFDYQNTPAPTTAPVPFIPSVTGRHQGEQAAGSFLFDTGAQLSIISEQFAFDAGLDENGDGDFQDEAVDQVPVGGLGGTVLAPLLNLETLGVEAADGTDLQWNGNQVLVLDIGEGIDGVIGANYLTGGWSPALPEGGLEGSEGPINFAHFDFRDEANSALVFDVKESAVPEPTSALLLAPGALLLLRRRRRTYLS